jgi:Lar family restriction alleviation protein
MNSPDKDHFTDMDGNPIEDSPEPSACPFCGSEADELVVERWSAEDDPDGSYHVECLKCGCNGPQAETQLEAAEAWNGRSS